MTSEKLNQIALDCKEILQRHAPYRPPKSTGNLRNNAIRLEQTSGNTYTLYISGKPKDLGIAPYVVYTNEPWISPKWKGAQNPNEGWIQDAVQKMVEYIRQETGGKVSEQ